MLISSKICQYIRPESETNTDAEIWEYLLVWQSPDGGVYCWLFEDFISKQEITGEIINTQSSNIDKVFQNAFQSVELVAEDLTENEFDTISDIVRAKIVRRYFKDNTFENLAIKTKTIVKPKSQARFNLEIEVESIEKSILK